jgi:hypothetical protein
MNHASSSGRFTITQPLFIFKQLHIKEHPESLPLKAAVVTPFPPPALRLMDQPLTEESTFSPSTFGVQLCFVVCFYSLVDSITDCLVVILATFNAVD